MIDDIGDFDPKKDPKYRPDIVRFLRRNRRMIAAYGPPRLVRLKYGNLLWRIGWLIDGDFIGGSLWIDKPTNRYCFVGISEQDIIAEVDWATYRRIGGVPCRIGNTAGKPSTATGAGAPTAVKCSGAGW